ncbi:MAG TPA: hypothetical protein VEL28_16935 [Candidatus Binatia bacterium]|nr:hypothetical protein [Candidatus Binatia bacterium]
MRGIRCASMGALLAVASQASAQEMRAASPADVCSANANPCQISTTVTIDSADTFDFGLRTVRILQGGKLRFGRATIVAGGFVADGPASRIALQGLDEDYGNFLKITARRACSGSPATPCLEDVQCAALGFGTCSVGSGAILLDAKVDADHNRGTDVVLRAATDVTINASVSLNGSGPEGDAGELTIDALQGDVVINGATNIRQSIPQGNYGYGRPFPPGYAGYLTIYAEQDVTVQRQVDMQGHYNGGDMTINAGRDIVIGHNVLRDGISGTYSSAGGDGTFVAGRDLRVLPHGPTEDLTFFTANAGHYFYHYPGYGGYGGFEAGRGGHTDINTGRDLILEQKTVTSANSPQDDCQDGIPFGGYFELDLARGFRIDGVLSANAAGWCGSAGGVYLNAYGDGSIGATGVVRATGVNAGRLRLSTPGDVLIAGEMNVRADTLENYYGAYGGGGEINVYGDDVVLSGKVRGGGAEYGEGLYLAGCRVRFESTADMTSFDHGYNVVHFNESFIAEPGSRMVGPGDDSNGITGGSPDRPPVLLGEVEPAPDIGYAGNHAPHCAPCGNGRIEPGESCDDGNITDGDGCTADCVNEGCIAQTAGYPQATLCDDGTECTADRCDALTGKCIHEPGCADDVACTEETCADSSCDVVPVDAECDDENPCTTDLCNAQTGCVHGTLVGAECEDGDLCTAQSICDASARCSTENTRRTDRGRITLSLREGATQDRLIAALRLDKHGFQRSITQTGLTIRLFGGDGTVYFTEVLPASAFVASDDEESVWIASQTIAEARIRVRLHMDADGGAEVRISIRRAGVNAAASAGSLGLSLLFGEDPGTDDCHSFVPASCRTTNRVVCRG